MLIKCCIDFISYEIYKRFNLSKERMKNDMEVIDKKKIWMRKMAVVIYR
jgi:hypothetical protein